MKIKIFIITLILIISTSFSSATKLNHQLTKNQNVLSLNFEGNTSDLYDRNELLKCRTIINLIEQLDGEIIKGYLENITSYGPRVTGTIACDAVAQYIYNQFETMDLDVRYQNWSEDVLKGKNVEATLKGIDTSSDKIYIICGHYDGVPESQSADDNGAGTASVLAAAKLMSKYKFNNTIRFVLFSGEEQGFFGSRHYASNAEKNKDNIVAVLNVDTTGYASNIENESRVIIHENTKSKWISEKSVEISKKYKKYINLELELKIVYAAWSDHFSFWQNGYDAIFYYESALNPDFHTPGDNINTVNITYATKIAKLAMATLVELCSIAQPIIGKTLFVGGTGGENYTKIMDAIEDTSIGDTVYVYNGVYNEKISIYNSIDLISEDPTKTYILYNGSESVISLLDDYIVLYGFTIKNTGSKWCSPGLDISSDNNIIINNIITDNKGYGIGLKDALYNYISYNIIYNNTDGIVLWATSTDNRIHKNKIMKNEVCGICISGKSDYTCIKWNLIENNKFGVYTQSGLGETPGNPKYANFYNNVISDNEYGMFLNLASKENKIIFNNFSYNKVGLALGSGCGENKIWKNNFIENDLHAKFTSCILNIWIRNYWDDRNVNIGPKIIKGVITDMPWFPEFKWYNLDVFPAKKPYKIEL